MGTDPVGRGTDKIYLENKDHHFASKMNLDMTISTYIHKYIHTKYTCAHIYTHVSHTHTYIHIHTYTHIHIHTHIHTQTYVHNIHTYIKIHICTHTSVITYIHTYTYIYTHTHIQ